MQTAFKITDHKDASKNILDEITLSYEERFIRRKKLTTDNGTEFLVNLEETVSVDVFLADQSITARRPSQYAKNFRHAQDPAGGRKLFAAID